VLDYTKYSDSRSPKDQTKHSGRHTSLSGPVPNPLRLNTLVCYKPQRHYATPSITLGIYKYHLHPVVDFFLLVLFIHSQLFQYISQSTFPSFFLDFINCRRTTSLLAYPFCNFVNSHQTIRNHAVLTCYSCVSCGICCCQPNHTSSSSLYVYLFSRLKATEIKPKIQSSCQSTSRPACFRTTWGQFPNTERES